MEMLTQMVALVGFCGVLTHAVADDGSKARRWFRYTRNGGMRFVRVGAVQMSFCITRKPIR